MHMAFSLLEISLEHLTPAVGSLTYYPEPTVGLSFVLGLPAFCDVQ